MIVRSSFALLLLCLLFIHALYAADSENTRQHDQEDELLSLIQHIRNQPSHHYSDLTSSEQSQNKEEDEEADSDNDHTVKRNKYTNFHVSPLWLSRRTRTNRIYGKPLWISRTG